MIGLVPQYFDWGSFPAGARDVVFAEGPKQGIVHPHGLFAGKGVTERGPYLEVRTIRGLTDAGKRRTRLGRRQTRSAVKRRCRQRDYP